MPYFFLKACDHRVHVGRHGGTVDADDAFLLGAFDQARGAVGALIGGDLGQVGLRVGRCGGKQRGDQAGGQGFHRHRPGYHQRSFGSSMGVRSAGRAARTVVERPWNRKKTRCRVSSVDNARNIGECLRPGVPAGP